MPRTTITSRRPKGFTLVELLIVMAVIALLITLATPSVMNVMVLARRTYCLKNLQNVGVSLRMYLNESNDVLPVAAEMPSQKLTDAPSIAEVLSKYLGGNSKTLRCPADTDKNYWRSEGSSYEYASLLGGRTVSKLFLTKAWGEDKVPVLFDYEEFHGEHEKLGSRNFLYADGHAAE